MFTFAPHVSHLELQESEQFPEHFGRGDRARALTLLGLSLLFCFNSNIRQTGLAVRWLFVDCTLDSTYVLELSKREELTRKYSQLDFLWYSTIFFNQCFNTISRQISYHWRIFQDWIQFWTVLYSCDCKCH